MNNRKSSKSTEELDPGDRMMSHFIELGVADPEELLELISSEDLDTANLESALTDNPFVGQEPNYDDLLAQAVHGVAEKFSSEPKGKN